MCILPITLCSVFITYSNKCLGSLSAFFLKTCPQTASHFWMICWSNSNWCYCKHMFLKTTPFHDASNHQNRTNCLKGFESVTSSLTCSSLTCLCAYISVLYLVSIIRLCNIICYFILAAKYFLLRDPYLALNLNTVYLMWLDLTTTDFRWTLSNPPIVILFTGNI